MIRERFQKAVEIITKNDRGGYTVPTSKLYPHQWNWDSAFTALGISTYNKIRAWQELILLIKAQWKNGMIPHIIFHEEIQIIFLAQIIGISNQILTLVVFLNHQC